MGFGFAKQRVSPIAVDFGMDSLKVLQVTPENPTQLVAAASAVVPADVRQDAHARYGFYIQALKRLLKEQPFKGRRAMLAIPAHQTLMQNIEVTVSEGLDIGLQVEAHLRDRLGIEPACMVVRHFEVGQISREGSNLNEVVCLAVPRGVVMRHLSLAQSCKLDVIGMHSVPTAILKTAGQIFQRSEDAQRVMAFLDIGATTTTLVIAHGTQIVFAKAIQAAAPQSPEAPEVAEVSKPPSPSAATGVAVLEAQVESSSETNWHATVDFLIDELQLCMRYYQSRFSQRPIEKLVFLGGESRHTETCQRIAKSLRIAAQLGDPFATLSKSQNVVKPTGIDLHQPQPGWAVPYGLCWSEANL